MKPKTNRKGNEYIPQGYDTCQTPPYALEPLLPYLNKEWLIWEPAAGEGILVKELYSKDFNVVSTDILTNHNFFNYEPDLWDCIVTNPPYSIKYKWLEHCYELGKPFALLMPIETLGAESGQKLFREFGINIILMNKRINFKMPNTGWYGAGAQFPVAWFTWQLPLEDSLVFKILETNKYQD